MGLLLFSLGNRRGTFVVTLMVSLALINAVVVTGLINDDLPLLTDGINFSPTIVTGPLVSAIYSSLSLLVCFNITGLVLRL